MADETKEEAERRKAIADADAAESAAHKARREEAESSSPSAVAQRSAKADADAAKTNADRWASFVPDFTKVTRGDLTVASGGEPTAGTGIVGQAIGNAAEKVAKAVVNELGADGWSVLITADADLASSDAVYHDVIVALDRLTSLASETLDATYPSPEPATETKLLGVLPLIPLAPVAVAAVASALPGVLSLLSRPRTVTTGSVTVSDIAAAMAVAGKLKGNNDKRRVLHDGFRLIPTSGEVHDAVQRLRDLREELAKRKLSLNLDIPANETNVNERLAASIALVAKVIDSIDHYLEAITVAPSNGGRSPLATALLRQELHSAPGVSVLLVKAESASGLQTTENRLVGDDKFSVVAAATVTWSLLEREGDIRAAGLSTGTAQANGRLGESFQLNPA